MSTTASIAQFMAILSGGANPALLRSQPSSDGEARVDFDALLQQVAPQSGTLVTEQDLDGLIELPLEQALPIIQSIPLNELPENVLVSIQDKIISFIDNLPPQTKADIQQKLEPLLNELSENLELATQQIGVEILENLNGTNDVSLQDFIDELPELSSILSEPTLNGADDVVVEIPVSIVKKIDADTGVDSSSIWHFIQQQANIDSGNQLVLNLSEKGLSDEVIAELKSVFGENDLVTIIRDPKLNNEFSNALDAVNGQSTIDSDVVVELVGSLLQKANRQTSDEITIPSKDIVVSDKDEEIVIDGTIVADNSDNLYQPQPVVLKDPNAGAENQVPVTPIQIALAQSETAGEFVGQQATPVSNSVNPFNVAGKTNDIAKPQSMDPSLSGGSASVGQSVAPQIRDAVNMASAAGYDQDSAMPGNQDIPLDLSNSFLSADGELIMVDGEYAVPFEAAFKTASQATNTVTNVVQASQSHPATQMVAVSLTKMAAKSIEGGDSQRYRLQLDPPEMGRIDIEMDIADKNQKMKIVITADKPESLGLLQRDTSTLLKAMQDAGFENLSQQDLSFQLSQQGEDAAGGRDQNGRGHPSSHADGHVDGDMDVVETEMSVIVDPVTGQRSVNMLV